MPKAVRPKTPVAPVAPAPPPPPVVTKAPVVPNLPVIYPKVEIAEYSTTSEKGPLDIEWCKDALGWETESEFKKRKCAEQPGSKPEQWVFMDLFHCRNLAGEKVRCNNNAHNRPFDEGWCESLVHTILYGQWAGPYTIQGETVNGETIRISRYGRVLSGQHQMTALILAGEWLAKARQDKADHPDHPKYPIWRTKGAPFIETIVIKGVSEDPRVLMTVDYVKPRTVADVFYTSEVFRDATALERKELCKLLAVATDALWTRTDARGYRTHPEIVAFLERHKKLLDCVQHIYTENSAKADRKISKLRLSPGQCAALCYIMGSAGPETDGDSYRNEDPAPSEKNLDWSLMDKAQDFWTLLAQARDFMPVRMALGRLVESTAGNADNQGLGGRNPEKLAILAKAWEVVIDHPASAGPAFNDEDMEPDGVLSLSYTDLDDKGNKLPDGQIKLLDVADFGGIDWPETTNTGKGGRGGPPMPPAPSREEIEKAKEEALKRRQQAAK